jgi:hypothetical protein
MSEKGRGRSLRMMEQQKIPIRNFILITAILLFVMAVASSIAFGVTYTWNGWMDDKWANPFNWDNDGGDLYLLSFPGIGSEVVFPERPSRYTVIKNNDIVPALSSIDITEKYELSGSAGVKIKDRLNVDIDPDRCTDINDSVKIDLALSFHDEGASIRIEVTCGYDAIIGGKMDGFGGIQQVGEWHSPA